MLRDLPPPVKSRPSSAAASPTHSTCPGTGAPAVRRARVAARPRRRTGPRTWRLRPNSAWTWPKSLDAAGRAGPARTHRLRPRRPRHRPLGRRFGRRAAAAVAEPRLSGARCWPSCDRSRSTRDNVTSLAYPLAAAANDERRDARRSRGVAIPLLTGTGCVGVMAVELRHNRPARGPAADRADRGRAVVDTDCPAGRCRATDSDSVVLRSSRCQGPKVVAWAFLLGTLSPVENRCPGPARPNHRDSCVFSVRSARHES